MPRTWLLLGMLVSTLGWAGCASVRQGPDLSYRPTVATPAYRPDRGPLVLIDGGHFNYHTADGRYRPFAELLRDDGYRVRALRGRLTLEALRPTQVLVIANALAERNLKKWRLPTPSAFDREEIAALESWVASGGALLLIADHMPFPGAASDLAAELGIFFGNGFVFDDEGSGRLRFRRDVGTLADHPITRGRGPSERVDEVVTFSGQAFRTIGRAEPLLILESGTDLVLPVTAWKFSDETPRLPATGMLQGAVLRHGAGRVAVFGEAAMFSAQEQIRGDRRTVMGMNSPEAAENAQFLLNVMHWLSGLLPE